jgi:uncharacterized protein YndB with AHSA1/START domain
MTAARSINVLTVSARTQASPTTAWRALTVDRHRWWPELEFDAEVGAALRETWTEDGVERSADGVVTEVVPPTTLAFAWRQPGWAAPLDVRFSIDRCHEGTTVTITETGFARLTAGASLRREHEEGWNHHLAILLRATSA